MWSIFAGLYAFGCGTLPILWLGSVTTAFADYFGVPGDEALLLASPALAVGAVLWWRLVERPTNYRYRESVAFGVLTAVGTVLLWVGWLAVIDWRWLTVYPVPLVIAFLLGVTVLVGIVSSLPLMFVRRRLGKRSASP
ncbi:hypothetical protein [Candidatus Halobonum tyrrellensis]|uniref:hypothetical protein n=1 Tax=Candidatus Halobonum tyrrellensis TaxID=1431545 RepID=UPI001376F4AB|nr:hypothetical protein [Candidatus Halobonum tyrrellensis]